MRKQKMVAMVNLVLSGFTALMISLFFAGGAIGENYTDKTFVAPEFFIILFIWGIGAVLGLIQLFKEPIIYLVLSFIITWGSIPLGVIIVFKVIA